MTTFTEHIEEADSFTAADWIAWRYQGNAPKHASAMRAFERWKQKARATGVLKAADEKHRYTLMGELGELGWRWVTPAVAAREMHVSANCNAVYGWIRKGAPCRKHGRFYQVRVPELRAWLAACEAERKGRGGTPITGSANHARVPVESGRPILLQVRDELEVSTTRLAELLGVKRSSLVTWLGTGGTWRKIQTIPAEVVDTAIGLLDEVLITPFCHARTQAITKRQVLCALEGGISTAALELGVDNSTLSQLCKHYGIDKQPYSRCRPATAEDKRRVLELYTQGLTFAAIGREIGRAGPVVSKWVRRWDNKHRLTTIKED